MRRHVAAVHTFGKEEQRSHKFSKSLPFVVLLQSLAPPTLDHFVKPDYR